ncbi:MAG: FtsW/RodA/SpoVE family cell cycle protein [Eubacterium sp.]|nr:FtsW/RodA/SpoVE family cell cycle protein [Eubacterium sp.]
MEEFIRNVTEQIRCVKVREVIAQELSDHIEDQAAAYEAAGDSYDEAVRKAVREMGDPVSVGVELDRIHRPQTDFKMIGMAFVFSVAGFFVLYLMDGAAWEPQHFIRQCIVLLLSFGVMAGMYFLDYSFIGRYAYGVGVLLTIVICVARMASLTNGAIPLSFVLAYLYVPVYAGILYRLRGRGYDTVLWGIGVQAVIVVLANVCASSLLTVLNVYMMCTVLFMLAVWKRWFAVDRKTALVICAGGLVVLPAVILLLYGIFFQGGYGFRTQRLLAWLHPEEYAGGAGYIYQWIRHELGAANLIGMSDSGTFASGDLLMSAMPYPTEPFVLIQLVCTYGILAGVALVMAFAAVVIRAFHIVRNQKNQLGFMISAACFLVLLVNCLEGVLTNTGYYPVSTMQFPFVSYGVCTGMTYAAVIGLLLSVHRNEMILTDRAIGKSPRWRLRIRLEKR